MATARCSSAPTRSRSRPSPTASPISRTATGRCSRRDGVDDLRRGRRAGRRGRWCARSATSLLVDKGNHRHFMEKEIYEQPEVVGHTLAHYLDFAAGAFGAAGRLSTSTSPTLDRARRSPPAARPTMPAWSAKYWFERFARLPVDIDVASEFRYRELPLDAGRAGARSSRSRARPPTRWPRCATAKSAGADDRARSSTCATSTIAREADVRAADARRAGDRRRLDQGLHLPARGARRARASRPAGRAARLGARRGEAGRAR